MGMEREILRVRSESIKLGVSASEISSVRTKAVDEIAVRVYSDGLAGVASAVGAVDIDHLTDKAKACLRFEIPYPVEPSGPRTLDVAHTGPTRSVDDLVAFTQAVLSGLTAEYPQFVFSHASTQSSEHWHIENDRGLDLRYSRTSIGIGLVGKEKGTGNIFDTFVAAENLDLDPAALLSRFKAHFAAFTTPLGPPPSGRQRVVFAGPNGPGGAGIFQLLHSDLVARIYAGGSSVFNGKVGSGERIFSSELNIVDTRDATRLQVRPFDMEGVVRDIPDLPLVKAGAVENIVASKRDAIRYGFTPTGSGLGGLPQLPNSGVGRLDVLPTVPSLIELLDGKPAVLVWFVAGGDCTRTGDLAMPAAVLLRMESDGTVSGRYTGATLQGNLYQVLGDDFIGVSEERVDEDAEEGWMMTHMVMGA